MGNCIANPPRKRINSSLSPAIIMDRHTLVEYGPTIRDEDFRLKYYNYMKAIVKPNIYRRLVPDYDYYSHSDSRCCHNGHLFNNSISYRLKTKNGPKDVFIWDCGNLIKINAGMTSFVCGHCHYPIEPTIIRRKDSSYKLIYTQRGKIIWSVMPCPLDPSIKELLATETYFIDVPGFGQVFKLPGAAIDILLYLPGIYVCPQNSKGWFYTYITTTRGSFGVFTGKYIHHVQDIIIIFDNGETFKPTILPCEIFAGKNKYITDNGYILMNGAYENVEYYSTKKRGYHTKPALH